MSASSPIVLDLSSDDEEIKKCSVSSDKLIFSSMNSTRSDDDEVIKKERLLSVFLDVTGLKDRVRAKQQLRDFDFDIDQCLANYFEKNSHTQGCGSKKQSLDVDLRTDKKTKQSAWGIHQTKHQQTQPSNKWKKIVESCRELCVEFVDQDFPPNSTSLDGRRQNSTSSTLAAQGKQSECRCGVPALIRVVQKDGPNYGRFFLSCGKPNPRKRRRMESIEDTLELEKEEKETSSEPKKDLPRKRCQFFQWDDNHEQDGTKGKKAWSHKLAWFRYTSKNGFYLTKPTGQFRPEHIKQGSMGNCWFLSALAVVAEKPYLMRRIFPHSEMNETGCYEVNFCLDGKWSSIIVDSLLPTIGLPPRTKISGQSGVKTESGIILRPAFAAGAISWPAIVEKAYAKVHGSYHRLNGGFISEALYDLTGAPLERIAFHATYDFDELFARLLSFSTSGFLMGIATSRGGDGLVSNHAYSLLGVYELYGVVVGEQKTMTNFFTKKIEKSHCKDDEVVFVKSTKIEDSEEKKNVRLVRIRNPWGIREWRGKWSSSSDQWTEKIRNQIGNDLCKQGDGTFFMAYEDMIQRFDHMDVAKCQEGWMRTSRAGALKMHATGDPLRSSNIIFYCNVKEKTWAYLSVLQWKKRANATSQFWYTDVSILILSRKRAEENFTLCQCLLQGVQQTCDIELFLDPQNEYCVIPFSHFSGKPEISCGAVVQKKTSAPIQFTTYSSKTIDVKPEVRKSIGLILPLQCLHSTLLSAQQKIVYDLGRGSVVIAINGDGCIYFVGLNSSEKGLLLNLRLELINGQNMAFGQNNDTFIVNPKSQFILLIVANDGYRVKNNCINFVFKTDSVAGNDKCVRTDISYSGLGTQLPLSLAGELQCTSSKLGSQLKCGKGTLDGRLWENKSIL